MTDELVHKPLVEVLVEVKWALKTTVPGMQVDPHYKLLLGRLYDRVRNEYPEHEQLPTAMVPDDIVGQIVQHRFRAGPNDWPLIQVGPGILTINDTQKYRWEDFLPRAVAAVETLCESYPEPAELRIQSVLLRYIDAVEFNYLTDDVFAFLRDKMNVVVQLPDSLFQQAGVERRPQQFRWQTTFACTDPPGVVSAGFATGQRDEQPALLWETVVMSIGANTPPMPAGFANWIERAHRITHDWFFKLIGGELERRFRGN